MSELVGTIEREKNQKEGGDGYLLAIKQGEYRSYCFRVVPSAHINSLIFFCPLFLFSFNFTKVLFIYYYF